jgi:hypothetical protein
VRLSRLELGFDPATFEFLCVRVVSEASSCIVALIYRPDAADTTASFYRELADVLDRLATYADPVYVAGDVNIRLERPNDPDANRFTDDLAARCLTNCVDMPTHDRGGMLDIVASRIDLPLPRVEVVDAGLSDHRLLRLSVSGTRPSPSYVTATGRQWTRLRTAAFRSALSTSSICDAVAWSSLLVDGLARLYDTELAAILDRLVTVRTVCCWRRASDVWFDDDCRVAKRSVRLFERGIRRLRHCHPDNVETIPAATVVWPARRRDYRLLLRHKQEAFWRAEVTAEQSSPQQL